MPVWKPRPDWLHEAVASALAQRGCDLELVVVDDGCETPVAERLSAVQDERLRILRVSHGGVARARNAGIEAVRGEFIRFLDCDDVVLPHSTAHLLELARHGEPALAYGATLVCDEGLRPLSTIATSLQGWIAEECLLGRFDTTIHSLLFPRGVVSAIGDWEPSIVVSQDWDYVLRALEVAPVRGDRRVATRYRTHPGMKSLDVEAGVRGYRRVVERYFERHPEQRGTALARRAETRYHLFAAGQHRRLGRFRPAFRHLRQALALDPLETLLALSRRTARLVPAFTRKTLRRLRTARRAAE